jgi:hypothetical protein
MTQEEKKQYILQHFKTSSGARITEMLKRYYASLKEDNSEELFKTAQKIFSPCLENTKQTELSNQIAS